jgi:hypothetical protein
VGEKVGGFFYLISFAPVTGGGGVGGGRRRRRPFSIIS